MYDPSWADLCQLVRRTELHSVGCGCGIYLERSGGTVVLSCWLPSAPLLRSPDCRLRPLSTCTSLCQYHTVWLRQLCSRSSDPVAWVLQQGFFFLSYSRSFYVSSFQLNIRISLLLLIEKAGLGETWDLNDIVFSGLCTWYVSPLTCFLSVVSVVLGKWGRTWNLVTQYLYVWWSDHHSKSVTTFNHQAFFSWELWRPSLSAPFK